MPAPRFVAVSCFVLPALAFGCCAIAILSDATTKDLLFRLHPLFMTAAFVLCFPYGIGAYRMEVMDAESKALAVPPAMPKLRRAHAGWQMWGSIFALFGLIMIISNKAVIGHLIAVPSVHAVLGILTFIGIIVQGVVGYFKLQQWESPVPEKSYPWHGIVGLIVFTLAIVTIVLGAIEWFPYSAAGAIVIIVAAILVWLMILLVRLFIDPESTTRTYEQIV
mmetsp:Transcript_32942/g.77639  ORF Transcript_32942/g.77639 Transcript_32942/m.77639 type:complete len:221 (+) Transcript_32942:129-791(+)